MVKPVFRQRGLTFLALLFAIALAGIALAGTGALWQLESRREKEKELLFAGDQYRRAIGSYYAKTPGDARQYPEKLEDLLKDNRFPNPVRHLRRLYREPMSDDGQWELLRVQGRITGVVSRSTGTPVKVAGFPKEFESFEGAKSYRGWQFMGADAATPGQANKP
jgi:type II secretory pathway pseudopilin PulG